MIDKLIDFLLINHLGATGFVVTAVCISLKVYIIKTCKSHPLYRGE